VSAGELVGVSRQERGALGLALSGGLGNVRASQEAAISAAGMAAVLRKLAAFAPDPRIPTGQRPAES
jgi:microcompartment protein CcmL/EutN